MLCGRGLLHQLPPETMWFLWDHFLLQCSVVACRAALELVNVPGSPTAPSILGTATGVQQHLCPWNHTAKRKRSL